MMVEGRTGVLAATGRFSALPACLAAMKPAAVYPAAVSLVAVSFAAM